MPSRLFALLCALLVASVPAAPALAESLAPGAPRVLIVNQTSARWPNVSQRRGYQVEMLLRHFTPETTRIADADYAPGELQGFDRVVVIGNDSDRPLPDTLLADLARVGRPLLWIGYNLDQVPQDLEAAYGFGPGDFYDENLPDEVEYRGQRYAAQPDDYSQVRISGQQVQVLATYQGSSIGPIPYVVRGGDLWYVNGLPNLDSDHPDPGGDAPTLVFADVLHDFFGTGLGPNHTAVIRLEDVSVHVDPQRLVQVVDYLYGQRVPFALGLIPNQRLEDGRIIPLADKPEFVKALRYAQDHGATIILHGYHHTYGSGEDFEFWDDERDAPLAGESWDGYAFKVQDGIRLLRDLGLEPRIWETPHYAGSSLAYDVFGRYFSHAFEDREPASWLPYPAGPDEHGQTILPETLGYINPADGQTVAQQLERARLLRIVRDGWAAGFYHPASVPLPELKALVSGLRREGYTFADLRALRTEVRSEYQPSLRMRLATWLSIDLGLNQEQLERRLTWWPLVRGLPWGTILLLTAIGVFLVRLREQWRPAAVEARSLVEPALANRRRAFRLRPALGLALAAVLVLSSGAWAFGRGGPGSAGSRAIKGWSSLAWTVEYDGYGTVEVEGDALSLSPLPARRPDETRAALVLGGDPGWRDYSFGFRMSTQQQLREGSPPNPWEAGWVFFRYQGEDRSYYLSHKPNGLELGKLVPPAGTGQIFLATAPSPAAELGRWYDYRIDVRGPTISVYVDGQLALSYTDPDPILSGRVGLYTEDAHVHFGAPGVAASSP